MKPSRCGVAEGADSWASDAISNFRPNSTEGSKKPVTASKGIDQHLRVALKRKPDFESLLGDAEIPELMLEDDGHFVREFLAQLGREPHARRIGAEGDDEMVVAGQAVARRLGQHLAENGAQGVLHQEIVTDEISRHSNVPAPGKWRLLLPGASEPRLRVLPLRTLISVLLPHYAATATGA